LIVEDELSLGRLYAEELEDEGYGATVVGTVREALEQIERGGVDALVLDLKLGVEDGTDVLKQVMEKHRGLPVIVNTGCGERKTDFRLWGADSFITKSSDLRALKRRLEQLRRSKKPGLGA